MSTPPKPLADIAHIRGLSGPIAFAFDTVSKPGKVIVHSLRFDSQEFENGEAFDATTFTVLHHDNDPRLAHLADCFHQGKE